MRWYVALGSLLLFALPVSATTYYVDSSITDTNVASATPDFTAYNPATFATTGGSASVYKTIADVNLKAFAAGDSVLFRQGQTWRESFVAPSSGSSGNVITYGAFGSGAAPIITGADSMSGFSNGGSNIWDKTSVTTQPLVVVIGATTPRQMVASRAACTTAGDWFWTGNTLSVYATSDPSGTVEANQRNYPILTNDKAYLTFSGLTVRGGNLDNFRVAPTTVIGITIQSCTIEHASNRAISLVASSGGTSVTIDSCIIRDVGAVAIAIQEQFAAGTISNNTITGTGFRSLETGEQCSAIDNMLGNFQIFGNDISNVTPAGSENLGVPGQFSHGMYSYGGDRTLVANIYNNKTHDNHYGAGIKVRGSSNVHHNLTYGNASEGIQIGPNDATNTVINVYYNVIYGNNTGNDSGYNGISQQAKGAGNVSLSIYGNLVYQNANTTSAEIGIFDDLTVLNIKNNILWTTATRRTIDIETTQTGTVSINNNLQWRADGNPNIWVVSASKNWAQWQALGHDAQGVNANPLLTSPTTDFTLQASSPAINVGADLGSTYQTALLAGSTWPSGVLTGNQNSYGAGWEIGAYIFNPTRCCSFIGARMQGGGIIK